MNCIFIQGSETLPVVVRLADAIVSMQNPLSDVLCHEGALLGRGSEKASTIARSATSTNEATTLEKR